ncbi:MAG: hypothetical protein JWN86_3105 [Planctomycetota bacterium]|nr:hypothetical protein [Planctomycetota bacterium]
MHLRIVVVLSTELDHVVKIECVTVCVDYADFLAETLPWNMANFEKVVVVTSFADKETQELCRRLSVECRPTDVMYADGDVFNKGRAIDFGMGFINGKDWICHLDADTWLPPMTRHHLMRADLDQESIHGVDRCLCTGYEAWRKFLAAGPAHQHDYLCRVKVPPFPLGDRISLPDHSGYIPIGFFQLWHGRTQRRYPLHHGTAERTDVLHSLQWPSRNRVLLGELIALHLESQPAALGTNWTGRKTPRFGPSAAPQSVKHYGS